MRRFSHDLDQSLRRIGATRGGLALPASDVAICCFGVAKVRLPHRVGVDYRHGPDRCFYSATFDGSLGEFFRRKSLYRCDEGPSLHTRRGKD